LEKSHLLTFSIRWDEWVPESRVLKYNPMNLKHQAELLKQPMIIATAKGNPNKKEAPPKAKAGNAKQLQTSDDYLNSPQIKIGLNDTLSKQLVDDWERITKSQKVSICAFNLFE
jgi:mortality factor 4-like protein 1